MRVLLIIPLLLLAFTPLARAQPSALAVGSALPNPQLQLQQAGDGAVSVGSLMGSAGTVFIFWSNQCRWTDSYERRVMDLAAQAAGQGIAVVLVNSNDAGAFPEESPEASAAKRYALPYVHDSNAAFAQALGAYRTPEVFAFDGQGRLAYTGAIDDAPGDDKAVTKGYLASFIAGRPGAPTKAFGCRIRLPGSGR